MLDYDGLTSLCETTDYRWSDQQVMLYALSLGLGSDPMAERELDFVVESRGPRVLPTFPAALVRLGFLRGYGIEFAQVLHGEQRLTLHRPLPAAGTAAVTTRVAGIFDKGAGRGALLCIESEGVLADGSPLFTMRNVTVARANGGFGGPAGGPVPHVMPARAPDLVIGTATRPDQALLYRLNGDRNFLHADPAAARAAGFDRPILHGLCSFGIAARFVVQHVCGWDETRVRAIDVRFTAPAYPGEALAYDLWIDGGLVSFRCRAPDRDVTVLDHGRCVVAP